MIGYLNRIGAAIATVSVLLMTLYGGLDVLSDLIFDQPLPGMYEATEMLMALVVFLAFASLQSRRGNINVDIFFRLAKISTQRRLIPLSGFVGLLFFGFMAWQAWIMAWHSFSIREYSQGMVAWPVYPAKFAFAIGVTMMVAQLLKDLVADTREMFKPGTKPPEQTVAKTGVEPQITSMRS